MSEREKELESRDKKNLSAQELGELYTLQIKSAAKEVHIRDQHLQLLAKNVEEARALAARSHEEAVSWGTAWPYPPARGLHLLRVQPFCFGLYG